MFNPQRNFGNGLSQNKYFLFNTDYSLLNYDANLTIIQTFHCDQAAPYSYKRANKSSFSSIVGVENNSFLDIKPYTHHPPQYVLIERGDVLFVKNDIPRRGCENFIDYKHHRVHYFCDPKNIEDTRNGNLILRADTFQSPSCFDASKNKFLSSFKSCNSSY